MNRPNAPSAMNRLPGLTCGNKIPNGIVDRTAARPTWGGRFLVTLFQRSKIMSQIESVIEQMKDIKSRDRRTRFQVEPGRGETYADGKPTVYAYSVYGRSSVLAGQERRIWVDRFDDPVNLDEFVRAARKAGIRVDVMAGSCFRHISLSHLPDDTDY